MKTFTCNFRGARVSVFYAYGSDEEAIWIANVVLGGRVQSIDGATALRSRSIQADIAQSVKRGLEWFDQSCDSYRYTQ